MGSDDFKQHSVVFSGFLTRLRRPVVFVLLGALLIMLPGCAPKRMKSDFVGFEAAYAETSNREVLLNLARLQNHDPTYFFKIGQISSLYRMQASLTGSGSYTVSSSNPLLGGPAGGGTSLLNYENDPSFTFIPVNDQTNAQFLLQPIPAETFYALYQQGWRVDQLFRLMVDRIELTTVTAPGVCSVTIYRNQAPQVRSDGTFDAATLSSYVVFLRVSALLYALQKRGDLILSGTNDFVPYDTKSALKEDPPAPQGRLDNTHPDAGGKVAPTAAAADSKSKTPSASDIVNALGKDAVWEKDNDGNWLLGQKVTRGVFYLNYYRAGKKGSGTSTCKLTGEADSDKSDTCRIATELLEDKSMQAFSLNDYKLLMRVLNILASGFSISEPSSGGANSQVSSVGPCPQKDAAGISSHLVMRSLVGIMASAAQEQAPFDALLNATNLKVPPDAMLEEDKQGNLPPEPLFRDAVPPIEMLPLLRLTGGLDSGYTPPLVQIRYRGILYRVADAKVPDPNIPFAPENQYWNRDIFRLVDQLTAQVTVDISKFPLPGILQLNIQ